MKKRRSCDRREAQPGVDPIGERSGCEKISSLGVMPQSAKDEETDQSWDILPNPQGREVVTGGSAEDWSALIPGPAWSDAGPSQSHGSTASNSGMGRRNRRDLVAPYSKRMRQRKQVSFAASPNGVTDGTADVRAMRERAAREKSRVLLLPSGTYQRHRLRVLSQIFKLLDKKEPPHDEVSDLMKSLALCFYCLRGSVCPLAQDPVDFFLGSMAALSITCLYSLHPRRCTNLAWVKVTFLTCGPTPDPSLARSLSRSRSSPTPSLPPSPSHSLCLSPPSLPHPPSLSLTPSHSPSPCIRST